LLAAQESEAANSMPTDSTAGAQPLPPLRSAGLSTPAGRNVRSRVLTLLSASLPTSIPEDAAGEAAARAASAASSLALPGVPSVVGSVRGEGGSVAAADSSVRGGDAVGESLDASVMLAVLPEPVAGEGAPP
jgi:Tfp pilus assembly protein FimV